MNKGELSQWLSHDDSIINIVIRISIIIIIIIAATNITTTCAAWLLRLLGHGQIRRRVIIGSVATSHHWRSSQHQKPQESNSPVCVSFVGRKSLGAHWYTDTQQPAGYVCTA